MHYDDTILEYAGDGVTLAATAWGNAEALPVLFFHGGGQNRRAWANVARHVGKHGYLGISFDHRGHGDSEWAADGDYFVDAYARDVERVIQAFDRPVVLVGASRGGQASLIGGSRHQDRVRLVVMCDVAPDMADDEVGPIIDFMRDSTSGFASIDDAADALAAYTGTPRPSDSSRLTKAMRQEGGRWFWHWDPRTVSHAYLNPPAEAALMREAAAMFRKPLVFVRAEHGSVVSDAGVEAFRALAPQLAVETAKGAHHMFTGDSNDAFARRLLHYLATAV